MSCGERKCFYYFFVHTYIQGMKGQELVEKIESGYRLECPQGCPTEIYDLMRKCWEYK